MTEEIDIKREKGSSILSGVDTTSGSGSSIGGNGVNHVEDFYEVGFLSMLVM